MPSLLVAELLVYFVLALSFLTVVGVVLIAEGMGVHIPKGYVYVAMAFSLSVELLNIRSRKKKKSSAD
jgi:predicted tellurium resistance membrane protein TerC